MNHAAIDACPHRGPSLTVTPDGTYHARSLPQGNTGLGKTACRKAGVALVTVNADMVQDTPEAAEDFLAKSGLQNAENWIFDDSFIERLRYEIDPKWQGEILVTLLIGRNRSIGRIEGSAKMPEVSAWLKEQQEPPPKAP